MSEFELRAATPDDCSALNAITQKSSAYGGRYRAMLDGYEISAADLEQAHFVVAQEQDAVVGYYSLLEFPEPELDLMFVQDAQQGTGLGATLFRHMVAHAASLGMMSVRIVSHPPSVGFYERQGAVQVGCKPARGRITWERPILYVSTQREGEPT